MGKGGKEKDANESQNEEGPSYEEKLKFVSCIAKPMASKKLAKKVYKVFFPTFSSSFLLSYSKRVYQVLKSTGDQEGLKTQGFCKEWPERCPGEWV